MKNLERKIYKLLDRHFTPIFENREIPGIFTYNSFVRNISFITRAESAIVTGIYEKYRRENI